MKLGKNRRIRLYIDCEITTKPISVNCEQENYLFNVMRCKDGDKIKIFNETSGEWIATITSDKKNHYLLPIERIRDGISSKVGKKIILAFAPTKKYGEFVVEKASEMGVDHIIPIRCGRSIVDKINKDRYRKAIIEAAEQCGRLDLPKLSHMVDLVDLKTTVENAYQGKKILFVLCDIAGETIDLKQSIETCDVISVIIGPEGGFNEEDYKIFGSLPIVCLKLNDNVLRAETASIASLANINFIIHSI